jgi:hypothetical protein
MKPTDSGKAHGTAPAHHYSSEELHNEDVAHEHSDINVRAIITSAVVLGGVVAVVFGLMYGAFRFMNDQAQGNDPQLSPLAAAPVQMPANTVETPTFGNAPQPQLLTNEYAVLARQRQAEEQRLANYGWIDEAAGVARIPIAEAKKLLAERGLPVRADAAADPTMGTNRPARGESSSGRVVDGPPRGAGLPEGAAPAAPPAGGEQPHKGGH